MKNRAIYLPYDIGDTVYVFKYNLIIDDFDIVAKTVKNLLRYLFEPINFF